MKRTARWSWADSDWGVLIKLSKSSTPERVGMALPKINKDGAPESKATLSESLLQRGLQRVGSVSGSVELPGSPGRSRISGEGAGTFSDLSQQGEDLPGTGGHGKDASGGSDVHKPNEEEDVTDAEGWTYGDNKWEGGSGKGGIGKVSVYAWTRFVPPTNSVPSTHVIGDGRASPPSPKPSRLFQQAMFPSLPLLSSPPPRPSTHLGLQPPGDRRQRQYPPLHSLARVSLGNHRASRQVTSVQLHRQSSHHLR